MDPLQQLSKLRDRAFPVMPIPAAVICAAVSAFFAALAAIVPSSLIVILTAIASISLFAMQASYLKGSKRYLFPGSATVIAAILACIFSKSPFPAVIILALCLSGIGMGRSFRKIGTCRNAVNTAAMDGGLCLVFGIALLWGIGIFRGELPSPFLFLEQLAAELLTQLTSLEVMTEQGMANIFDENSAGILVRYAFMFSPAVLAVSGLILCILAAKLFHLLSRLVGGGYIFPKPWHIEASFTDAIVYVATYTLSLILSTMPSQELYAFISSNIAAVFMPFLLITAFHSISRFLRDRISPKLRILCLLILLFLIVSGLGVLVHAASCFGAIQVMRKTMRAREKQNENE